MISNFVRFLTSIPELPITIVPSSTSKPFNSPNLSNIVFPVVNIALGVFINPAPFTYTPFGLAKIKLACFPAISVNPSSLDLLVPVISAKIVSAAFLFVRLGFPLINPAN